MQKVLSVTGPARALPVSLGEINKEDFGRWRYCCVISIAGWFRGCLEVCDQWDHLVINLEDCLSESERAEVVREVQRINWINGSDVLALHRAFSWLKAHSFLEREVKDAE